MKDKVLVGIFTTEEEARRVIQNLKDVGYSDKDISVIAKEKERVEHIHDVEDVNMETTDNNNKAVGGAVTGGVIGGAGALLAEIGLLAIPGIGPFLAAGPIAVTLGGIVAGGAVGGLIGALVDLGIDKEDAKEYETYLERGDILVAVKERDDVDRQTIYRHYYDNNSVIRDTYDIERGMW